MWQQKINIIMTLCLFPLVLSAIPEDDLKNIEINANHFQYDNIRGVAIYSGNVIAKQGSREFTGDKLEVIRNDHGNIAEIIMHGKPAQHQSLTDISKPLLFAKANTIKYNTSAKHLTLIDDAWVKQAGDEYSAPTIEYDETLQTVKSPANNQGRTTIILEPRP